MLPKLLIAFFTTCLLSACGGGNDITSNLPSSSIPDRDDTGADEPAGDSEGDDTGAEEETGDDEASEDEETSEDTSNSLVLEMGDMRWGNNGSEATLEFDSENDVLVMTPDFTQVDCPQDFDADALCNFTANHTLDGPLDLRGAHFVIELDISQSILDNNGQPGGIVVQAYGQVLSGSFGGFWGCELLNQEIEGTSVTFECTLPEDNDALNFPEGGDAGQVGLQVLRGDNANEEGGVDNSIEGTITLKSFAINLDGPPPSDDGANGGDEEPAANELAVKVDADWQNDGTPAIISFDNGVVITPDWDAGDQQTAFVVLDEAVDLTDATVTYVIDVPQSYIDDGGMVIQPFSQQNEGSFTPISDGTIPGGWNPTADLNAGENTIVHGPFSEPPENIQRIGVWLNKQDMADGVTGDIVVRSVTVTFPE